MSNSLLDQVELAISNCKEDCEDNKIHFSIKNYDFFVSDTNRSLTEFRNRIKDERKVFGSLLGVSSKKLDRIKSPGLRYCNKYRPVTLRNIFISKFRDEKIKFYYNKNYFTDGCYIIYFPRNPNEVSSVAKYETDNQEILDNFEYLSTLIESSKGADILFQAYDSKEYNFIFAVVSSWDRESHFIYDINYIDVIKTYYPITSIRLSEDGILFFHIEDRIVGVVFPLNPSFEIQELKSYRASLPYFARRFVPIPFEIEIPEVDLSKSRKIDFIYDSNKELVIKTDFELVETEVKPIETEVKQFKTEVIADSSLDEDKEKEDFLEKVREKLIELLEIIDDFKMLDR